MSGRGADAPKKLMTIVSHAASAWWLCRGHLQARLAAVRDMQPLQSKATPSNSSRSHPQRGHHLVPQGNGLCFRQGRLLQVFELRLLF